MKTLRRRQYARICGFTYKRWNDGTWYLGDGKLGTMRHEYVSDKKFIQILKIHRNYK